MIAPAVISALDDHRVSRFQQDLSLVEERRMVTLCVDSDTLSVRSTEIKKYRTCGPPRC